LQAENDWLHYQHQLLAEMCRGFDWFRHLKLHALLADPELMQLDGSVQLRPDGLQQEFGDCLATGDEARLLQQLSTLPYFQTQSSLDPIADLTSALDGANPLQERSNSSSASMKFSSSQLPASNNSSSSSSAIHSLAPPGDPLWLLKHVMSKPFPACCEGIEIMTLQELQAHYKSTVHDLSLYLVQHSAGGVAGADEPHSKIQAVMTEHLKLIGQLCTCRSELVTALQLVSNCNVLLRHPFSSALLIWLRFRVLASPAALYPHCHPCYCAWQRGTFVACRTPPGLHADLCARFLWRRTFSCAAATACWSCCCRQTATQESS
jgi:hypothetical protein